MTTASSPKRANLYPLLPVVIAFLLGICFAHTFKVDGRVHMAFTVAFAVLAFVFRSFASASLFLLAAFFALGAFCLRQEAASVGTDRIRTLVDGGMIASGSVVEIEGALKSPPEPTADGTILTLKTRNIIFHGQSRPASGTVQVYLTLSDADAMNEFERLDLKYGSRLAAAGEISREERYQNPGVTSRIELLDQQGIDATLLVKSPQLIENNGDEPVFLPLAWIFDLRQYLIEQFHLRFSISTAGVLSASMLGDKYLLDKSTADVFREGGTFHVLVISGLHITFIGGILFIIVSILTKDRLTRFAVITSLLWAYTLAVGAEPPVVRASLMFSIMMFGQAIGRQSNLPNSFGACLLILLAWRPSDLFDPSLQLTVLSVGAIVFVAFPLIEKLRSIGGWMPSAATPFPPHAPHWLVRWCEMLYWNPAAWKIESSRQVWSGRIFKSPYFARLAVRGGQKTLTYIFEGLLISVIMQLCLLPVLVVYFLRVTPVSIVMNLWVGVTMALESFAALVAIFLSGISEFLGAPFFSLTEFLNYLLVTAPSWLVNTSWASWRLPNYSGTYAAIYFVYSLLLIGCAFLIWQWKPFEISDLRSQILLFGNKFKLISLARVSAVGLILLGGTIVFHPFSSPRADGRLHVDFLDVGQGDAAFVTFPDGTTMLIDGGGRIQFRDDEAGETFIPDTPGIGESVVSPVLWNNGYSRVDLMLATHADADHMQGLSEVAENFEIGRVLLGREPRDDPEFRELDAVLRKRGVSKEVISRGKVMKIGGATVEVIYPLADPSPDAVSDNNHSVVVRIICGSRAFLLTGDIEHAAERELLAGGGTLRADVVKVAHHGSRTSSTSEFVDATDAEYAVISVGRRSRFGHPHREVVDRWSASGTKVMTTGEGGMISLSTDGRDLIVSTYK
jgi:competence protein ComEC